MAIVQSTDQKFQEDVLSTKGTVLVDFWAPWCGPCVALGPVLEDLDASMGDQVKIVKVNIDENPDSAVTYGVRSIPTMLLFKDGDLVSTQVGSLPKNALETWIKSV
jgi:thioredoxin 1